MDTRTFSHSAAIVTHLKDLTYLIAAMMSYLVLGVRFNASNCSWAFAMSGKCAARGLTLATHAVQQVSHLLHMLSNRSHTCYTCCPTRGLTLATHAVQQEVSHFLHMLLREVRNPSDFETLWWSWLVSDQNLVALDLWIGKLKFLFREMTRRQLLMKGCGQDCWRRQQWICIILSWMADDPWSLCFFSHRPCKRKHNFKNGLVGYA